MSIWEGRRVVGTAAAVLMAFLCGVVVGPVWAFKEAPMLAAMVKEGKLPPVDKRLPSKPMVVKPLQKVGTYGGQWRRAYKGISDLVGARRILYDPLVRWSPDFKVLPNLAEKWEISDNGKSYTFHLVKGVKWSDGVPFTADDILFYFDDILFNKELTPAVPKWLSPGGQPPKITKIDGFTIKIDFAKPYGLFLEQLASPNGMELVTKPKHYLKQFHKKYADPAKLEALVKEKKASSWIKMFRDVSSIRTSLFVSNKMPSICAWITKTPAPAQRFIMERNPFYWKIDSAGNQLPYIDRIVHKLQTDAQTILLDAVAGNIDMQGRRLGGMQNAVLLLASLSEGKYRLVPKVSTASVGILLAPNLNHKDPALKKILSDPRFRKALSYAINRDEINKIVYQGKGVPRQAAPLKESAFYSESYAKAYTKFDPKKAGALLDEMGLKKDTEGRRIKPDGKPLQIVLDVMAAIPSWVDTAEIVASNLGVVGINTEVKSETRGLFTQRIKAAEHDIALWPGDGGMECLLEPRWYFPYSEESLNAPLYGLWYQTGGKKGVEPSPEIRELMELYNEIVVTVSEKMKKELFAKIIAANEKNLWVIGLVYPPQDYYVVATNMYNVPKKDFQSWTYPNPGPVHPEQFFFKKR